MHDLIIAADTLCSQCFKRVLFGGQDEHKITTLRADLNSQFDETQEQEASFAVGSRPSNTSTEHQFFDILSSSSVHMPVTINIGPHHASKFGKEPFPSDATEFFEDIDCDIVLASNFKPDANLGPFNVLDPPGIDWYASPESMPNNIHRDGHLTVLPNQSQYRHQRWINFGYYSNAG